MQAHLVVGALRAEGLQARVERNGLGAVYGLDRGAMATKVLVAVSDADEARKVLEDLEGPED